VPTPTPQHLTTTATEHLTHHPHLCHPLTTPTPAAPATLPTPCPHRCIHKLHAATAPVPPSPPSQPTTSALSPLTPPPRKTPHSPPATPHQRDHHTPKVTHLSRCFTKPLPHKIKRGQNGKRTLFTL